MSDQPRQLSEELLEQTHTFPTHFTFKAVGPGDGEFEREVLAAVHQVVKDPKDVTHSTRASSSGKHASVSLDVRVENARQVVVLYQKLSGVPRLAMLL